MQYAKRGVPPSLRCRIYKKILYADQSQKDLDHFDKLNQDFESWESALDEIIKTDINQVCNDDKYFIFQEIIEQGVQLFFRDRQVLDLMKCKPHATVLCTNAEEKIIGAYPPCGVIPYKKFSAYFAPLGFISNTPEDCYYIFRSMYCKYYCYLNSISSHP